MKADPKIVKHSHQRRRGKHHKVITFWRKQPRPGVGLLARERKPMKRATRRSRPAGRGTRAFGHMGVLGACGVVRGPRGFWSISGYLESVNRPGQWPRFGDQEEQEE